jgi:hypothetical protein
MSKGGKYQRVEFDLIKGWKTLKFPESLNNKERKALQKLQAKKNALKKRTK